MTIQQPKLQDRAPHVENLEFLNLPLVEPKFSPMLNKASATQFLPVFVMAPSDDLDNEVRAIDAGADEFLTHPLRPRSIRARIQASLRHKAMIDSLDHSETVLFSLAQSVEERDPG